MVARGMITQNTENVEQGIIAFGKALDLRKRNALIDSTSDASQMDRRWTQVQLNRAKALRATIEGDYGAAADLLSENRSPINEAIGDDPNDGGWKHELAADLTWQADVMRRLDELGVARALYQEAGQVAKKAREEYKTQQIPTTPLDQLINRIDHAVSNSN